MLELEFKSKLPLIGTDGNAYALMGQVTRGLKQAGAPKEYVDKFLQEAMSGDYYNLLRVCAKYTDDDSI